MEEAVFLAATVLVELAVALLILRNADRGYVSAVVLSANLFTHPLAWQAVSAGVPWLTVEGAVVLVEMGIFAALFPARRSRAMACAVLMNMVSAAIGRLM